ncbi:MAG: bifunctional protein-serine/threonine kinase/phosphatase [Rhodospirillales bacterium]|nr:bifunctional protein-serine/threonine kinase/phosphatase [Rhodospirillales bacterium]
MRISVGQHSDKGRKETNQDFHGALIPDEPTLSAKGVALAVADGISTSAVSHIAAESAVKALMTDYYCTSDAWSVKTSAQKVLAAINSWLHAQTVRGRLYDKDRGYVTTLSALIVKSATAHIFHVGDSRVCRLAGDTLEQLTNDHRVTISPHQSYLGRAMGVNAQVEIDYTRLPVEMGEVFVLATDGVYEFTDGSVVAAAIAAHADDLDRAARRIVEEALARGSGDNLTVQIARIDALPDRDAAETADRISELPLAPLLEEGKVFDGFTVVREIHASNRSHIYLAVDTETNARVALKTPSIDLRGDPDYLRRFMMEDWVAHRISSAHVLRPFRSNRKRTHLYIATEFIEGQTLAQWMTDHPRPDLESVRAIVEQIAKGLRAFHRLEMLHQDLRPANILIDRAGTVKIIDFGSTRVSGVREDAAAARPAEILGTAQYTAPEYFLGEEGTTGSDIFSLGVIAYQMLSGRLPYGAAVAKTRSRAAQRKLAYRSVFDRDRPLPAWIDGVLRRAVHPDPSRRYSEVSEFSHELRHPNPDYLEASASPLLERDPVRVWKTVSFLLLAALLVLAALCR